MFNDITYFKERKTKSFIDISMYRTDSFQVQATDGECLVSEGALHFVENPKKYFDKCAMSIEKNGFLFLSDKIVDINDAAVNTAAYFSNKDHRRFYRVEEIIDFTKHSFVLEFFARKNDKSIFIFKKI